MHRCIGAFGESDIRPIRSHTHHRTSFRCFLYNSLFTLTCMYKHTDTVE